MRTLLRGQILLATLLALAVLPPQAVGQDVDPSFWWTDGTVEAVAVGADALYVGGTFEHVGPRTGVATPLDPTTGALLPGFPEILGTVNVVIPDGSGGWFVGGDFSEVGGVTCASLARIASDLSVVAWNPNIYGEVHAAELFNGVLYVGGDFATAGAQFRSNLAAFDIGTGSVTGWNPGTNGVVYALDVHTHQITCPNGFCAVTQVYVGGAFDTVGGQGAHYNLAAIDPVTGAVQNWYPNPNGAVHALGVVGSTQLRVYVGGDFTSIGQAARTYVAALNVSGVATSFDATANGPVRALSVIGSTIYAGGHFTQIGGQLRNRIAALGLTGAASSWNPNSDGPVEAIAVDGSTVHVGGSFSAVGGQVRQRIAALDVTTGAATSFDPNADGEVRALAAGGGTVYAGGTFQSINRQRRQNLAAFDLSTGAATAWTADSDATVLALAVEGSTLYAGGQFTLVGGQPRAYIAALEASTGTVEPWNPGADGWVETIVPHEDTIYIGGEFTTVGGQPHQAIAAIDAASGAVTSFDPAVDGTVESMFIHGSTLYFSGTFYFVGIYQRISYAAVDLATAALTPWIPPASGGHASAMVTDGTTAYLGGDFVLSGGESIRQYLAAVDLTLGEPTPWNPGTSGPVRALALNGSNIYVGGSFFSAGNSPFAWHFAEINLVTGQASIGDIGGELWNGANGGVLALASTTTHVYVGGAFTMLGNDPAGGLAATAVDYTPLCDDVVGSPGWPACGTTVGTTTTIAAWSMRSVPDGLGGVYLCWQDISTYQSRLAHVDADGVPVPGWPSGGLLVSDDVMTAVAEVVADDVGGVYVVWRSARDGEESTRVARYDASGALATGWPVGGLVVPGLPVSPFGGAGHFAATDGAGGVYVASGDVIQRLQPDGSSAPGWTGSGLAIPQVTELVDDAQGGAYVLGLYDELARIDPAGSIDWQGDLSLLGFYFVRVDIDPDGTGGVYVGFDDGATVRIVRVDGSGAIPPTWPFDGVLVSSGGTLNQVEADEDGGVYVLWTESSSPTKTRLHHLQASNGVSVAGWPAGGLEIGDPDQEQKLPSIAPDGAGGVYLNWLGWTDPASTAWYGLKLCQYGTVSPGWPTEGAVLCPDAGFSLIGGGGLVRPGMIPDGDGGAFVPLYRRTASVGYAGTISVQRMGSTPPEFGNAAVAVGSPSMASSGNVSLNFDTVSSGGDLIVALTTGPPLPEDWQTVPAQGPAVYDISTTADWTGSVEVCIGYSPADLSEPDPVLDILHYVDGMWDGVTTYVDTELYRVCGVVSSLSPFVLVENSDTQASPRLLPTRLDQNHPNPFNPRTTIRYRTDTAGTVRLAVYDLRGRLVRELVDEVLQPGSHEVIWNGVDARGRSVASGVYFYRLETPGQTLVRRMALVR